MDRLLIIDPQELIIKFEVGEKSSATISLKNVMYTMPVAFKVQPNVPKRYTIKPTHGIIPPLGTASVEIILNPQTELPAAVPRSHDKFTVKSVVVPGGSVNETVSLDWFTAKKKQVYSDHGMRVVFIGGGILRKLVEEGSMEDVREVLELDEKLVDCRDEEGRTPMHIAVARGRAELVQLLLEFNGDVEAKTKEGKTVLQEAASLGEDLIVELLLARGATAGVRGDGGWTALHEAVRGGHKGVVRLLLEAGGLAVADDRGADGRSAVFLAVERSRTQCLELLLAAGADPNAKGPEESQEVALHKAAELGDGTAIELLLKYGANKFVKNGSGQLPGECLKRRLIGDDTGQLAAELTLSDDLLLCASRKGLSVDLFSSGNLNLADDHGWTALHRSAFKGHLATLRSLLDHGADLESVDHFGFTPLHCAAMAGHEPVIHLLLKHGAPVNACSHSGSTPLHLATALNYPHIARLLVFWGASDHSPPFVPSPQTSSKTRLLCCLQCHPITQRDDDGG